MSDIELTPAEVEEMIHIIRGQKVMLDSDLAKIYGVSTTRLNEQVKRNQERFPEDFMFRLTREEFKSLISQIATSKGRGGRRKLPYVFTEHGAVMLASVLNSPAAIEASVQVVRAFVRMRVMVNGVKSLAHKIEDLERKLVDHDEKFAVVFNAIRQLMMPPDKPQKQIGFKSKRKSS